MKFHALVVDDSPEILEDVKDRLEALGHTCDCVNCLQCARENLAQSRYSHALVDLEIPVRYGRPPRIQNGQYLVREIRATAGYETLPIIVMTGHGHDSPDLAVEVLRCDGATDFVKKPFPSKGHTLEKAVMDALAANGRSRPGAAKLSSAAGKKPPQPLERGKMAFSEDRVDLCGVKICGGSENGMIRRILDELRKTNSRGAFIAYSGSELAKKINCSAGQNGVAGAIREFRQKASELLLEEANIKCGPHDIIQSGGPGYRLTEKIVVRDANDPVNADDDPVNDPVSNTHDPANAQDDPVNDPVNKQRDPVNDPVSAGEGSEINERQQWAVQQMRAGKQMRVGDITGKFGCSKTTAKRDLTKLRRLGLVEFIGPPKIGHWRLVR